MTTEFNLDREQIVARILSEARPIAVVYENNHGYMPIVLEREPKSPQAKFILDSLIGLSARITQREEELLHFHGKDYMAERKKDTVLNELIFNRDLLLGRTGDVHTPVLLRTDPKTSHINSFGVYSFGSEDYDYWSIILASRENANLYPKLFSGAEEIVKAYLDIRKTHAGATAAEISKILREQFYADYDAFLSRDPKMEDVLEPLIRTISERYQAKSSF
jgi:hypothetical protein